MPIIANTVTLVFLGTIVAFIVIASIADALVERFKKRPPVPLDDSNKKDSGVNQ